MALTKKQEAFCQEYARTGDPQKSYLAAGYKTTTANATAVNAHKLKNKPEVKARLQEIAEKVREETEPQLIADAAELQRLLTEIIRQQTTEEVLFFDPMASGDAGRAVIRDKKTASIRDVISAAKTLAQIQGLTTNNVNVGGSVGVVIVDDLDE